MSVQTIKFLSTFGTSLLCLLPRPLVKCFMRQQMLKVSSIPVWTMCQMNAKLLIVFVTKRASLIESRLVFYSNTPSLLYTSLVLLPSDAPLPCEADVSCKNGGTCIQNTRMCRCPSGWKGDFCEEGKYIIWPLQSCKSLYSSIISFLLYKVRVVLSNLFL